MKLFKFYVAHCWQVDIGVMGSCVIQYSIVFWWNWFFKENTKIVKEIKLFKYLFLTQYNSITIYYRQIKCQSNFLDQNVDCLFVELVFSLILLDVVLVALFKVLGKHHVAVLSNCLHTSLKHTTWCLKQTLQDTLT